jgi:hypothetical protein
VRGVPAERLEEGGDVVGRDHRPGVTRLEHPDPSGRASRGPAIR